MDSIHLTKTPPVIALLGEGIKFELLRVIPGAGQKASLELSLNSESQAYPDKNLILSLPSGEITFVFRENPDESGLELHGPDLDEPLADFVPKLAAQLSQNYLVNKDYVARMSSTGYHLLITARNEGVAYNISFVSSEVVGIAEEDTIPGGDITPSDFAVYTAICLYNSDPGLPRPLGEELTPVNVEDLAQVDLAAYLKDQLSSSFHYPYNGGNLFEVPGSILRYFIRYGEYSNGSHQKLYNDALAAHYAVAGMLSQLDRDYLSANQTDFFSQMQVQKFLTWAPLTKITYPNTPERLYFLLTTTGLKLRCKKSYVSSEETIEILAFDKEPYTIVELHVGVSELFPFDDLSNLKGYDIWVENDKDETISEVRSFIVDTSYYLNIRSLFFKNSLGMFDVINCTGQLKVSDQVKRDTMTILSSEAFRNRVLLAQMDSTYELNTGWLPEGIEAMRYLQEIQLSGEAYLVYGSQLLPIWMDTGKIIREQDGERNYSMSLTFHPDYENQAYSALVGNQQTPYYQILLDILVLSYQTMVENDGGSMNADSPINQVYYFLHAN